MVGELANMKALANVRIDKITDRPLSLAPLHLLMDVSYTITAADGTVMYQETFSRDMSKVPDIGKKTLAERYNWAVAEAVKDARSKYGN